MRRKTKRKTKRKTRRNTHTLRKKKKRRVMRGGILNNLFGNSKLNRVAPVVREELEEEDYTWPDCRTAHGWLTNTTTKIHGTKTEIDEFKKKIQVIENPGDNKILRNWSGKTMDKWSVHVPSGRIELNNGGLVQ